MFENDTLLHIGTSSWSSADWVGPFYPQGLRPERFIEHYSTVYDTVEVDATFYRMPTKANVQAWKSRTPEGFLFALKTPQIITHEKVLEGADDDMAHFLEVASGLEGRLGPILLQFPYFNKKAFASIAPFLLRLEAFLAKIPSGFRIAVEVRNKAWVKRPLCEVLRSHGAALAWVEQSWMPSASEWDRLTGGSTAPFAYLRWLGDRKAIEEITTTWDKTVIDREPAIEDWVPVVRTLRQHQIEVFGYFNNHFAGHAPSSVELFRKAWQSRSATEINFS